MKTTAMVESLSMQNLCSVQRILLKFKLYQQNEKPTQMNMNVYIWIYVCMNASRQTCISLYVYMYVLVQVCIHVSLCVNIGIYFHMYACVYVSMYIYMWKEQI